MLGLPPYAVAFDCETRSRADLRAVGGQAYADHPSTELLSAGWQVGAAVYVWSPRGRFSVTPESILPPPAVQLDDIAPVERIVLHEGSNPPPWLDDLCGLPWVAHNGLTFDAPVWRGLGLPEPVEWLDSLPWCRAFGLPAGIDRVGLELFGGGKDAGKDALMRLSQPAATGKLKGHFLPLGKQNLPAVLRYMVRDIQILSALCALLRPLIDEWGEPELAVVEADAAINTRGVRFDTDLAEKVVALNEKLRAHTSEELFSKLAARLGIEGGAEKMRAKLRSVPQCLALLEELGVVAPDAKRATLQALALDLDPDDLARDVIAGRIGETRVTAAKLDRGLAQASSDGRLRFTVAYHAAHTGRWGGRGMQLQNLPRPNGLIDAEALSAVVVGGPDKPPADPQAFLAALPVDAKGQKVDAGDGLAALVRASLIPDDGHSFRVMDYANIEARVLPWLAGDEDALEVFRRGGDPYISEAAKLFGASAEAWEAAYAQGKTHPEYVSVKTARGAGKVIVLSAGYGGGARCVGDYAKAIGVDLAAAGTTPEASVEAWRDAHPLIAGERNGREWQGVAGRRGGFWRDLEAAFREAIERGSPADVGRVRVERWHEHVVIILPSGRPLIYREARIERVLRFGEMRECPTFERRLGVSAFRTDTYGGKLVENCLAGNTRVLTSKGYKRLDALRSCDLLWDGVEWVTHQGLLYKGKQETISWLGVRGTENHLILAGKSWKSLTHLDAATTAQALSLGRVSVTSLRVGRTALRRAHEQGSGPIARSVCARVGRHAQRTLSACSKARLRLAQRVRIVVAVKRRSQVTQRLRCSEGTSGSIRCGPIVTRAWSAGVPIRTIAHGRTTAGAALRSSNRGSTIGLISSATPRRSPNGAVTAWTSTASTMTGTTDPETSASSRAAATPEIAAPDGLNTSGSLGPTSISANASPPIGRAMRRRGISLADGPPKKSSKRIVDTYDILNCGPRNRFVVLTNRGPVIAHNCTQAAARDVMAGALVRLQDAVVLHVHDELVCSGPEATAEADLREALCIMTQPFPWSTGLPIAAEGFVCRRYRKGDGTAAALDGRLTHG